TAVHKLPNPKHASIQLLADRHDVAAAHTHRLARRHGERKKDDADDERAAHFGATLPRPLEAPFLASPERSEGSWLLLSPCCVFRSVSREHVPTLPEPQPRTRASARRPCGAARE